MDLKQLIIIQMQPLIMDYVIESLGCDGFFILEYNPDANTDDG